MIPAHYNFGVTPWDLELHMQSSGNAFVDSRRSDAIEYAFCMKGDLLGDLKKARHCLDAAIEALESCQSTTDVIPQTGNSEAGSSGSSAPETAVNGVEPKTESPIPTPVLASFSQPPTSSIKTRFQRPS